MEEMIPNAKKASPVWWEEAKSLVEIFVPSAVIITGMFVPQAFAGAVVGKKIGIEALDGFSLGSVVVNIFTISTLQGLALANDMLSPQAYGAGNYREVGVLAIRGFIVCMTVLTPPMILLCLFLEQALLMMREPPAAAAFASEYFRIFAVGMPANILFTMIWKFLSAQEIMKPLVIVTVIACGIILPFSVWYFVEWFGFAGAPWALVLLYTSQSVLLLSYLAIFQPHQPGTWEGLSVWREAFNRDRLLLYVKLGFGGIMSNAEWWFWEVVILVVGTLGSIPLSIHTIAVQSIGFISMFPIGAGIALSVRIGITISQNALRAKKLVIWGYVVFGFMILGLCTIMWFLRFLLFSLFTSNPTVIEGANELWWKVVVYIFLLSASIINTFVGSALGMQWTIALVFSVTVWIFAAPSMYWFGIAQGGGLQAIWSCLLPPYVVTNGILMFKYLTFDWERLGEEVRKRDGNEQGETMAPMTMTTERTPLV